MPARRKLAFRLPTACADNQQRRQAFVFSRRQLIRLIEQAKFFPGSGARKIELVGNIKLGCSSGIGPSDG
jgi:hypothetical protein